MTRARLAAALFAGAALLSGCATPRVPVAPGGDELAGRLSVQVAAHQGQPARSVNGAFELRGSAERGELVLASPLGTTLARARWAPGSAQLESSEGNRRYPDLDSLATDALGEALPLAALFDWLRGRAWAGAPHARVEGGFEQLGWRVATERLPEGFVTATRAAAPAVTLRARLELPS